MSFSMLNRFIHACLYLPASAGTHFPVPRSIVGRVVLDRRLRYQDIGGVCKSLARSSGMIYAVCKGEESSDSTGPIFIPRRRGAARRRSRRCASLPMTSPIRRTASWIKISDYRPTSDEDGLTSHNVPPWARPDATANPRR